MEKPEIATKSSLIDTATLGSGCFWCSEAVFSEVKGVLEVVAGYSGGRTANPDYESVCSGTTGHAEVVQIVFNPDEISYRDLLGIFWATHDPTTLNRQGADIGTQYRSVIFYHNDAQKQTALALKQELGKSGAYDSPLVTEIAPMNVFYKAEEYHQDYYQKNPYGGYCQVVIKPKMDKFRKVFKNKLK